MLRRIDHGEVRELRLDRPPANALSLELLLALREAVEAAPREGAGALVLSGRPGMFCAGHDVPALLPCERPVVHAFWTAFLEVIGALVHSPIPIHAAITGHSPAGGTVLALFCDGRIMAEGPFQIGLNEVQVGITVPPVIFGAFRRLVGPGPAARLALAGTMLTAAQALEAGLVDELVPPERVVDATVERSRVLLALPRQAMLRTREAARADLVEQFPGSVAGMVDRVVDQWFSAETQAALGALVARLRK
ncbi:MAG: enoyl-CoA hydratase/isomerase family protein [Deltaproteobacteria bacterium]|nr:enoyl-CoA hydratase/isomerase family protein [Deltaproteobacteria bacterium]